MRRLLMLGFGFAIGVCVALYLSAREELDAPAGADLPSEQPAATPEPPPTPSESQGL